MNKRHMIAMLALMFGFPLMLFALAGIIEQTQANIDAVLVTVSKAPRTITIHHADGSKTIEVFTEQEWQERLKRGCPDCLEPIRDKWGGFDWQEWQDRQDRQAPPW